jgi:hypothetical protein
MGRKTAPAERDTPLMYSGAALDLDEDDGKDNGQPFKFDPNFSGPVKQRSCTDVICLGIFLAFLGGWGFVAFFGITKGDINKVNIRPWKDHFKSDLRSDQDHRKKNDLRSDQDHLL